MTMISGKDPRPDHAFPVDAKGEELAAARRLSGLVRGDTQSSVLGCGALWLWWLGATRSRQAAAGPFGGGNLGGRQRLLLALAFERGCNLPYLRSPR